MVTRLGAGIPQNSQKIARRNEESTDVACMASSKLVHGNELSQVMWYVVVEQMPLPESDEKAEEYDGGEGEIRVTTGKWVMGRIYRERLSSGAA